MSLQPPCEKYYKHSICQHEGVGCQSKSTKGRDYRGNAHRSLILFYQITDLAILCRTEYGDECLNWRDPAILKKLDRKDVTYDHNYCRNPIRNYKREKGVWCYTGLGNTKALCDVPWCLQPGQSLNSTVIEKESMPAILTATIILGIASFFVTVLICLIAGPWLCCNKPNRNDIMEL